MVYDCFIFFNELDLLELRLNILDSIVDKFVLVEATRTFQGKEKPLYFSENKHRFEKFLGKIIHVVVTEYPDNPGKDPWAIECHQRRMIAEGLLECDPGDVILISDVDEIPDPLEVTQHMNEKGISILRHRMFYYFLNCVSAGGRDTEDAPEDLSGTVMIHREDIRYGIDMLRKLSMILPPEAHRRLVRRLYWKFWLYRKTVPRGIDVRYINNAGWHFSFLGGVDKIIEKLESFSHVEYNRREFKDPGKIEELISNGRDILGRRFRYRFIELDSSYPEYLLKNVESYKHLIQYTDGPRIHDHAG